MTRVSQLLRETPLRLRARYALSLPRARDYLQEQLRQDLSKPGSPTNRSRPGEHPRMQTGRGRASTRVSVDLLSLSLSVHSNFYMKYHQDHGRPWLDLTWRRVGPNVKRLVFPHGLPGQSRLNP